MANLFSEELVGYSRLHEVIDSNQPLRRVDQIDIGRHPFPGDVDPAVQAVQIALFKYFLRSGDPSGIYDAETKGLVTDFQRSQFLPQDGVVGPPTLTALDNSFPQFHAVVEIVDISAVPSGTQWRNIFVAGTVLGNIFIGPLNASPPGKIGSYWWPGMPGAPGSWGSWRWNIIITPGQGNKPISASSYSVEFDHFQLNTLQNPSVKVAMRFDAPSRLWVGASAAIAAAANAPPPPANSYPPANPWFPHGANGTGQDFRGVDIAWRVF